MKTCTKCNTEKPFTEFYAHQYRKGDYKNHCKECIKRAATINFNKRMKDPVKRAINKKEKSERYYRLGYYGAWKNYSTEKHKEYKATYWKKFPEKLRGKLKKDVFFNKNKHLRNGMQHHHWSYNEEHLLDFSEMTLVDHKKLHRYMIYDQERMMYRRTDNRELLDTKEKHIDYFEFIINKD